jgi:hypothetical protein
MKAVAQAIRRVVEGDLDGLSIVLAVSPTELLAAATSLPRLTVSRSALIRILKAWRSGDCTADNVRQWASFVRRGYVSGAVSGEVRPIEIEYDVDDEQVIVEIISRLDQIVDEIVGEVDAGEREEMLKILRLQ